MATMRYALRCACITAVTLMVALTFTASLAGAQQGTALAAADRTFAGKAAVGGQAEVELGKLAQERASNNAVRHEVHDTALDLAEPRTDRGEPRTLQGQAQHLDHVVRRVEDGDDGTHALFRLDRRR
jgi:hypothetical protein